jgi:tRNA 2-thiouridine synthesizing protein A
MVRPENYLDCRGKLCPIPLLETRRAIDATETGSLVVVVDRLAARENIAQAMVEAGHEVLVEEREGEWVLTVTKGATRPSQEAPQPASGPTVALITDQGLGRTDPELGRILMRSFLATLGQSPTPPAALILMQGGVRLACEGSDCLEAMRALQERGVSLLACGTCLDYFGLVDRLRVGRVSNMAEIVETLAAAGRIIPL